MSGPLTLVRRYPIAAFALLAWLFGWSIWICAALGLGSNPDNMPFGPAFAALIVTACQGRDELRAWGRRLWRWGASPIWYVVAFVTPALVHIVNVLLNHLMGAPLPTTAQLSQWWSVPIGFGIMLVMVGIGEEAGWTAFAAPLLLRRHGLFTTWAILAPIRILWHLPLMIHGDMPWLMGIVGNAAFQMLVLQVFVLSGRNWSPAAVWHASLNAFGGMFFFPMVTGADNHRLGLLLAFAYAALALVVLPWTLRRLSAQPVVEPVNLVKVDAGR